MMDNAIELVDSNIVVVLSDAPFQPAEVHKILDANVVSQFMHSPVARSQALIADPRGVTFPSHQIESMRSQITLVVNPVRIEVHDRSGDLTTDEPRIPNILLQILALLGVEKITAIGANHSMSLRERWFDTAARGIAERIVRPDLPFMPPDTQLKGASTKLFLNAPLGQTISMAIESRFQDLDSAEVWLTSNVNVDLHEVPDVEYISALLLRGRNSLLDVAKFFVGADQAPNPG